ncbi:MAG: type II secretion system F family protein [Bacilli bacterium]|nr:type II secretion system F family protein [Bacilli bacterium]
MNQENNSSNKPVEQTNKVETPEAQKAAAAAQAAPFGQKAIKIGPGLLADREKLIQEINSNQTPRSDHQITYRYTALNPEGKIVKNTFVAYSKMEVFTFFENEGYKVFKVETSATIERFHGANGFLTRKMSTKDLVFWLEQLSTYLKAGIPLTQAMEILCKQMGKNDNLKRIFDKIVYDLTLGENFSTCLENQSNVFPALLINMIKTAEATGDLEGTLDDMASYYSDVEKTKKEMKSALTYPILILLFAFGVVAFILVYLVPQFENIYDTAGAKVSPLTNFIIQTSRFLKSYLIAIILIIIAIVIVIILLYKNVKAIRFYMQKFAMKMPVFGNMIIYKEITIFTRTFSNLLKNNVFITESMDILVKITNNEIYKEIMINTVNYIGRGDKISEAFKNNWAIPQVAYYMMQTGESTGQLAEMMEKVANYFDTQHKTLVETMKSLIEPVLILFLAVVVGGIVIAIIMPMFGLYQELM